MKLAYKYVYFLFLKKDIAIDANTFLLEDKRTV
jgi:hypothetical protein